VNELDYRSWIALLAWVVLGILAFSGLAAVPFHPDESSLLYQSRDLEILLSDPLSLAWQPDVPQAVDSVYRALNPPFPKYILGLGRRLGGYGPQAVAVDWDWSSSWNANVAAGALPPPNLLKSARAINAALAVLAMILIYQIGKSLGSWGTGVAAMVLFGLNALVLLHARRAMSEASLLFSISLLLWAMLHAGRRPWLVGIALGLSVASKSSAAGLAPAALAAILWPQQGQAWSPSWIIRQLVVFLLPACTVFVLLTPFIWLHPVGALAYMWQARQALQTQQAATFGALAPGLIPGNAAGRLAALIAQLFLAPPQLAEAANYRAALTASYQAYLAVPWHSLMRGIVPGGLMLGLTLFGIVPWFRHRPPLMGTRRRVIALLLAATIFQSLALLIAVQLPFQRYDLPLVPMVVLWQALGLAFLMGMAKQRGRSGSGTAPQG
jgi:4-amino-4-deoxy-L-arabinose transferase-like glycosyltransferase